MSFGPFFRSATLPWAPQLWDFGSRPFPLLPWHFLSLPGLCQVQGTCLDCGLGHFSHFLCRSSRDCFAGEHCVPSRGFCCPLPRHNPPETAADSPKRKTAAEERCPADGGAWGRMCKRDADCLFRDELCAEGKCCPSESMGAEWELGRGNSTREERGARRIRAIPMKDILEFEK